MTTPKPPPKQDVSKPIIKVIAAIVVAVIIIAVVLTMAMPKLQEQISPTPAPTPVPTPAPAAHFTFPSKTTYSTSEGGFLGIGANVVVWVEAVVKNTGDAAGGCTVNVKVESTEGSGYWTQEQGVYLQPGQEQTVKFKFDSGPHNEAYRWSVWTS